MENNGYSSAIIYNSKNMTVNILGTEYKIAFKDEDEDGILKENNGYCDPSIAEIVVCRGRKPRAEDMKDLAKAKGKTLRHEMVRAFLFESGLKDLAYDETIVEWIAYQIPKMVEAMKSAKCL